MNPLSYKSHENGKCDFFKACFFRGIKPGIQMPVKKPGKPIVLGVFLGMSN
jgi:hypothetical protein